MKNKHTLTGIEKIVELFPQVFCSRKKRCVSEWVWFNVPVNTL